MYLQKVFQRVDFKKKRNEKEEEEEEEKKYVHVKLKCSPTIIMLKKRGGFEKIMQNNVKFGDPGANCKPIIFY